MSLNPSISSLARGLNLERAIIFSIATRIWQLVSGPVSMVLIAKYLSNEEQGYFYTFSSVLALQSFIELGFYLVIISAASHEWAHLNLSPVGEIQGDAKAKSRLVSLGHLIFKWYSIAACLFLVVVGGAGWFFFSSKDSHGVYWQLPWITIVGLSAVQFFLNPFNSLLEGCGQFSTLNLWRFIAVIIGSSVYWSALSLGLGLWAAVIMTAFVLLKDFWVLGYIFRKFWHPFMQKPECDRMDWRTELWPMQWRLAAQGAVGYFLFSMFSPVMFYFHGPVVAGQMGMTWVALNAISGIANTWMQIKTPQFGALISQNQYTQLDTMWRRVTTIAIGVAALGGGSLVGLVWMLQIYVPSFSERLLPVAPTAIFVVAMLAMQVIQCIAAYLRAHKREPLVAAGVIGSVFAGVLIYLLGKSYGATGAAIAFAITLLMINLPWSVHIFRSARADWHR